MLLEVLSTAESILGVHYFKHSKIFVHLESIIFILQKIPITQWKFF
jgi:hypothetical protein